MKRSLAATVATATLLCALSGCAPAELPDAAERGLDDYRFAVAMSPSFAKIIETTAEGEIVFVDDSGNLSGITTQGIDGALLAVGDGTLYFTDQNHDYTFADTLTEAQRATREYSQELLTATSDGFVSVFNSNYADDGLTYQYDVSASAGGERRYPHYFELLGHCDDDVYGVAVPESVSDSSRATRQLVRVHPYANDDGIVGSWVPTAATLQEGLDVPCVDRELYFLSTELAGPVTSEQTFAGMSLRAWNVDTGDIRSVALTDESGAPFAERNREYAYLTRSSWSIVGTTLYWIDGDGVLLATSTVSGLTREIATLDLANAQSANNRIEFDGTRLYVFEIATEARISTYRLSNGELLGVTPLNGVAAIARANGLIVTDFAVLPNN